MLPLFALQWVIKYHVACLGEANFSLEFIHITNASKGLSTRGVSSPNEPRWLRLLCLSVVVMRCQPLRRALYASEAKWIV